ncbi:EamA domain-containing protein [Plasmodiophora brassicae]|uniref:EamA domain-containing protein n=1 Tax=Plasmodiophora brassicae TaxID=37360 RepID=A0A0G4J5J9_PLABS|nr:hypothetical protein PBRA_002807 [Plasmodiophora brassicae]SPQ94947.1 unnamed protein product [Plasmodiophora brassicae]
MVTVRACAQFVRRRPHSRDWTSDECHGVCGDRTVNSLHTRYPSAMGVRTRREAFSVLQKYRTHVVGTLLLLTVVGLYVANGHFTKVANRPFFSTYSSNALCFIYLIVWWCHHKFVEKSSSKELVDVMKSTSWVVLQFLPLYVCMSFTFNWSLSHTTLTSNSIISATSSVFTLMFSYFMLKSSPRVINVIGSALLVGGVVCVAVDPPKDMNASIEEASQVDMVLMGNLAAVLAACIGAFYFTYMKKRLTEDTDMTLFFGLTGLIGTVLLLPVVVILQVTHVEDIIGLDVDTMLIFLALAGTNMLANYLYAKVVVYTTPFVATVGLGLTNPLNMIVDKLKYNKQFGVVYLCGIAIVLIGVVVTNIQHKKELDDAAEKDAIVVNKA